MHGVFISVTNVRVSPDLGIAHAYLSIFPSDNAEMLITNINDNVKSLRYDLGKRVGKQLRVIPELTFHLDDSLDYIENIDRLLKND
jgi:ribosome-binding factor A